MISITLHQFIETGVQPFYFDLNFEVNALRNGYISVF